MKRIILLICLTVVAVTLPTAWTRAANPLKSESGWFDFEGCAMCKHIGNEPGLLAQTKWENHAIRNGMMNIVSVEAEYSDVMAEADRKMKALDKQIRSGELEANGLPMCLRCRTYSKLIKGDVNLEEVRGQAAVVTLVTSGDAKVIAQLHELARRDTEEMARLKGPDHGHKH